MTETDLALFGVSAGILNVVALVPYIRDIFQGNTKPERATWWVWFTVALVSFVAQVKGGAHWSLALSFSSVVSVCIVALLSIQFGYGKFHRRDTISLTITGLGVVLSFLLRSPLLAVVTVILIDAVGAALTLFKTWYAPHSENFLGWAISATAATFGLLAVGDYTPVIFLAPLSNAVINGLMVFILVFRRPQVALEPSDI